MTKAKTPHFKSNNQTNITQLFLLTAAGGLLGVTAGMLLAPKSGKRLRQDLCDTYEDITEKGEELVHHAAEKGSEYVNNVRDTAHEWMGEEGTSNTTILMGLAGGALLGATAIYLLTKESQEPEGILDKVKAAGKSAGEKLSSGEWIETAREFLDKVSETTHPKPAVNKVKDSTQETMNELFKWANVGFSVWQNLQKRG